MQEFRIFTNWLELKYFEIQLEFNPRMPNSTNYLLGSFKFVGKHIALNAEKYSVYDLIYSKSLFIHFSIAK